MVLAPTMATAPLCNDVCFPLASEIIVLKCKHQKLIGYYENINQNE